MTSAILGRTMPWTEEEFLALGETSERVELFDGELTVTPASTPLHQHISFELKLALRQAVRKAGLTVHEAVNVRLEPGRIPIPDLVITEQINLQNPVIDAEAVLLVCEITSPSNAATDKVRKMEYYAGARIPWYLLVEQTGTLHLFRLNDSHYVEHSVTPYGEVLHLREPVEVDIDTAELRPPDFGWSHAVD